MMGRPRTETVRGAAIKGAANPAYKHGHYVGKRATPERAVWQSLKNRCHNPNDRGYRNYGGRGIQVCDEWRESFMAFFEHVGPRPSTEHSLDRIDNNGNYEPGNVRWVTRTEQNRNTRRTRFLTYDGLTLCVRGWEEYLGFNEGTLQGRLDRNWPVEEALSTPLKSPSSPRRKRAA